MLSNQYVYGFFDGEGTIVHHKNAIEVHLTQCKLNVLELVKQKYGGTIIVQRKGPILPERVNGIHRNVWRWKMVGYNAAQFLREALPYLIVKKDRAREALNWWDERISNRKRKRMPNAYYAEMKEKGLPTAIATMTSKEKKQAKERQQKWLEKKGWD